MLVMRNVKAGIERYTLWSEFLKVVKHFERRPECIEDTFRRNCAKTF